MAALWSSGPSPMTIRHVCVYASLCAPWCNFFPLTNILSDKRVSVSWKEGRRQHRPEGNRGNVRWDCTHRAAGFSHVSSDTWELFYSVGVCRSKRSHIAFKVTHTRYPVNDRDQIMCLDVLQWKVVGVKPVFIWSYPLRPLSYLWTKVFEVFQWCISYRLCHCSVERARSCLCTVQICLKCHAKTLLEVQLSIYNHPQEKPGFSESLSPIIG